MQSALYCLLEVLAVFCNLSTGGHCIPPSQLDRSLRRKPMFTLRTRHTHLPGFDLQLQLKGREIETLNNVRFTEAPSQPNPEAVNPRAPPTLTCRVRRGEITSADYAPATRRYRRTRGPHGAWGPMPGLAFAKHTLRWRLLAEGFSSHLPVLWQRWAISLAFRRWAEVVPLSFQEDPNAPLTEIDIQLGFGTGRHLGCPWVFDGLGGELAHTSRPGEIHLDDDETYSIHPSEHGVNLMQVTMHEIGHVLGLPHLTSPDSVMHPLYPISGDTMELGLQDRRAIQELYGQCEGPFNTVFDWVRSAPAGQEGEPATWFNTYFLRGDKYWLYDNSRRRPRPRDPRSLAQGWKGLPRDGVDAYLHVWTPDLDYTYFFKGIQYWCYDRKVHQTLAQDSDGQQYPQCISEGFPGVTGPLDTAVFLQKHQLVYFFKGYQVWAFNVSKGQVQEGFPKLLKDVFPPLLLNDHPEGNLDASYYSYSHRALFLIKGLHYWKVSSGGKSDKPRLLPRGKVAEEWKDLCSVDPSTLSKR